MRFLDAFLQHGVSWFAIRKAAERARELLRRDHPFSSRMFKTDGRTILADLVDETDDRTLIDLVRNQYEFERIVSPLLYAGIEFNDRDEPERWFPLSADAPSVVIDPARSFGAPITVREGIPTRTLAIAVRAEGSIHSAADFYEVAPNAVRDAVTFETRFPE